MLHSYFIIVDFGEEQGCVELGIYFKGVITALALKMFLFYMQQYEFRMFVSFIYNII